MTIRRGSRAWMRIRADWAYRLAKIWAGEDPQLSEFICRKCDKPILPGQEWDLGHLLDQAVHGANIVDLQPEHSHDNRGAGGRLAKHIAQPLAYASRDWNQPVPIQTNDHARRVVLLCGPPGSGKSTLARQLATDAGLTVYDSDEPRWTSEHGFRLAIAALATNPTARAVVIRFGATAKARSEAAATIAATEVIVLTTPLQVCERQILRRRRNADPSGEIAGARRWWRDYQAEQASTTAGHTLAPSRSW